MRNYNLGSVCPLCSGSSQLMECFILLMSETRPGGGQTLDNLVTLISALLSLTASHWSHLGPRRPVRGLYIFSCPVRASDWMLLAPMLQCSNAPCSNGAQDVQATCNFKIVLLLLCSYAPMLPWSMKRCTSPNKSLFRLLPEDVSYDNVQGIQGPLLGLVLITLKENKKL